MVRDPAPAHDGEPIGQRVRVGALGLACVFLLVMLATALLHAAGDAGRPNQAAAVNGVEPDEPLATLGVAPGNLPPDGTVAPPRPTHAAPVRIAPR